MDAYELIRERHRRFSRIISVAFVALLLGTAFYFSSPNYQKSYPLVHHLFQQDSTGHLGVSHFSESDLSKLRKDKLPN